MFRPHQNLKYLTPYEFLKQHNAKIKEVNCHSCTEPVQLDDIANQMSDNEFAERMVKARSSLFEHIRTSR
jgi:hypothetical protein